MTEQLEERLAALRGELPRGDWLDVRRRVRRRRWRKAGLVAVAATLAAIALVPLGVAGRIVDLLAVESTEEELPRPAAAPPPYVFGDRLYVNGRESALTQRLSAPLLGQDAHLAITSPGKDSIVYHAWRGPTGGPGPALLRRHSVATGADEVLVRGAQSFAWRDDGAVAYMRSERAQDVGHVEVRSAADTRGARWTSALTGYVVRAWARETLLVEVRPSLLLRDTQPDAGIYAVDGPGTMRRLPISDLIAVSPDGRHAVGRWRPNEGPSRILRLVDVASGRTLSEVRALNGSGGPGDWRGDRIVAVSTLLGKSSLVVLAVDDELTVRETLALDESGGLSGYYGDSFQLPLFVSRDEVVVSVSTIAKDEADTTVRFLTCDLGARRCRAGRALEPETRWAAVLTNPSRP